MPILRPNAFHVFTLGAALLSGCGDDDGPTPDAGMSSTESSGATATSEPATETSTSTAVSSETSTISSDTGETESSTAPLDGGVNDADVPPDLDSGVSDADVADGSTDTLTTDVTTADTPDATLDASSWMLSSSAFHHGETIPDAFTCEGGDFASGAFPGLDWTAGPPGTKSYAVVFVDTSIMESNDPESSAAAYNRAFHWAIWDVPATAEGLPAALGEDDDEFPEAVPGARQWAVRNQFGFFPPCPNSDPAAVDAATLVTDEYAFILYALDAELFDFPEVSSDPTSFNYTRTLYDALEASNAVLGRVELRGTSDALSVAPRDHGETRSIPSRVPPATNDSNVAPLTAAAIVSSSRVTPGDAALPRRSALTTGRSRDGALSRRSALTTERSHDGALRRRQSANPRRHLPP